ncbi:MAG TPA: RdgB/HAM1 family non-canonical purine NTP pyrophosphatase [Gaiellaceae bacterium]|nr:RdgB/HAM1 family non-canonical purine NTP pyrophosphatase [Gaiellaceae bacterium]
MRFVLATTNEHKVREIVQILSEVGLDVELVPRPVSVPDVDETGATFEDNARQKATAVCAATGTPAIADDSGLVVDALGGAPGVHSARYAGDDPPDDDRNLDKLIDAMADVPDGKRTARYVAVAVARFPDGREVAAFGEVEGVLTREKRDAGEGFGYDPLFVPLDGDGRTFAEMPAATKHEISHRGRAFRTLADGLRIMEATSSTAERPDMTGE